MIKSSTIDDKKRTTKKEGVLKRISSQRKRALYVKEVVKGSLKKTASMNPLSIIEKTTRIVKVR